MVRTSAGRALGAVLITLLLAATVHAAEEYTERFARKSVECPESGTVRIVNRGGSTRVRPAAGPEVVVRGTKVVYADSRAEADELFKELSLDASRETDAVSIQVIEPARRSARSLLRFVGRVKAPRIDIEVEIPSGCRVEVTSRNGDIDVLETEGETDVKSAGGEVEVSSHRGPLTVHLTSGKLTVESVEGPVEASSTSGEIEISDVRGNIAVHTVSGGVTCDGVEGRVTVKSGSGDVYVSGGKGDADVATGSGDVEAVSREGSITLDSSAGDVTLWADPLGPERYEINCSSGDVDVRLPEDSSVTINVWTTTGTIYAKIPMRILAVSRNNLKGQIGRGGVPVNIKTNVGNVRILPLR